MNVLIAGAGNGGTTIAADLTVKGHKVTLLKTSNSIHNEHYNVIANNGFNIELEDFNQTYKCNLNCITDSFNVAFENNYDAIIIYVQTKYHETLIKKWHLI